MAGAGGPPANVEGPWVCGNCRSVNRAVDGRCYSCRMPRAAALDPQTIEATARRLAPDAPTSAQAAAARALGATLHDTGVLATVAQVAVLVVTAITLAKVVLVVRFVLGLDPATLDPNAALDQLVAIAIVQYVDLAAWFLGLVAWGAWLARVVGNIPGLGGGWPHATPRSAFLTTLIPGGNLYWTTSIMREALTALSPKASPRLGILTAWWLALTPAAFLLLNVGPVRYVRYAVEGAIALVLALAGGNPTVVGATIIVVELAGAILLVTAAGLAIVLVQALEGLQAERRAALGGAAAPARP